MICAWNCVLSVLPRWLRANADAQGRDSAQEIRLRLGKSPEVITSYGSINLLGKITKDDISFCINTASQYSPWKAETAAQGYITIEGGHRIGLCGSIVMKNGIPAGMGEIRSLNIRVARDFPGISDSIDPKQSLLIIGAPGWGKTTLLRDLSRRASEKNTVAVVDERRELFPDGFYIGSHMDILSGCPKKYGIEMVLRTMGPSFIAVDEITREEDCTALIEAANCGVKLLATTHAATVSDLKQRSLYRSLIEKHLFDRIVLLQPDKHFLLKEVPD